MPFARDVRMIHVSQVGMAQFNAVWTDAETLPRTDEIEAPERWTARVLG